MFKVKKSFYVIIPVVPLLYIIELMIESFSVAVSQFSAIISYVYAKEPEK